MGAFSVSRMTLSFRDLVDTIAGSCCLYRSIYRGGAHEMAMVAYWSARRERGDAPSHRSPWRRGRGTRRDLSRICIRLALRRSPGRTPRRRPHVAQPAPACPTLSDRSLSKPHHSLISALCSVACCPSSSHIATTASGDATMATSQVRQDRSPTDRQG